MLLDIKNNELIFSKMPDVVSFRKDMLLMKDVKFREYNGKFYVSLADLQQVREVLSPKYSQELSMSFSYEKFAKLFILCKGSVEITWNPDVCQIKGPGIPWKEVIPATSYFNKTSKNSHHYGKSWSGYVHLFNPLDGTFPSGLLERVVACLINHQVPFQVNQTFTYPEPYLSMNPTFPFTPTEDQIRSVEALAQANNGIAKLPTGFGKTSYVAGALMAKKGVKSIFLANQRVLTDDAKKDFDDVFQNNDLKIGLIGDGIFDPGDVTVASIQTVAAALKPPKQKEAHLVRYQLELAEKRLKDTTDPDSQEGAKKDILSFKRRLDSIYKRIDRHNKIIPFLKEVDLFIVDEAQVLGTEQWNKFLHACPAPYRYTLSATPTRTDGGGLQIVAATGNLRFESSASEQIEKGRLSEFTGHFTKFDHGVDADIIKELDMDYHQAYDVFIVQNPKRNDHLCNKVLSWYKNHSVLALVTRKEHGEIVKRLLLDKGVKEEEIHYLDGDSPKKLRRETIEDFRSGKFPILIGTSIFDVGFNAKNAAKMVRFNAGGSEVREPQRAGRTVRLRDDGSIGETYDMLDINAPFFEAQGWKRLNILREEFGSERVKLHKEIVAGELNVVGLQEVVAAMPAETDRQKGEDILQRLQFGDANIEVEGDYDLDGLDRDLGDLLSELTTD